MTFGGRTGAAGAGAAGNMASRARPNGAKTGRKPEPRGATAEKRTCRADSGKNFIIKGSSGFAPVLAGAGFAKQVQFRRAERDVNGPESLRELVPPVTSRVPRMAAAGLQDVRAGKRIEPAISSNVPLPSSPAGTNPITMKSPANTISMLLATAFCAFGTALVAADETKDLFPIGSIGKQERVLNSTEEAVLFEHVGPGCLNHFWFGGNSKGIENTRIRYYVDGEETPSIDMNLYMGHGVGFNDNHAPWATRHMGKIGKRNGFFNNYQIPFGKSIRVTARRLDDSTKAEDIWWIVRGVGNGRAKLGGITLPESARLKLHRLEDHTAQPLEEFNLCQAKESGAVFQVALAAQGLSGNELSYLEACMRAYSGGSPKPVMLSSGLEDYFLGTYYFDTGKYHNDTAGLTHLDPKNLSFSAYRIHDSDPIFFNKGLRLTCRNGETKHGTPEGPVAYKRPPPTRFTAYTWIYEWPTAP